MFSFHRFTAYRIAVAIFASTIVNIPFALGADGQSSQRDEFESHRTQTDLGATIDAAQKRVAAARADAKTKPLQLSDALVALGDVQREAEMYSDAEATYREALSIVEKETGPTNDRRLAPLRGLGMTLARESKHPEAIVHLATAIEVSRRVDGLFNVGQLPMLDQLALSELTIKDFDTAQQHINYYQRIGEQAYGKQNARMVPVICTVGDWWSAARAFITARLVYERAIAMAKKTGADELAMVRPLRSIARTYVRELISLSDHESDSIRVRRDSMHLGGHGTEEAGPDPKTLSPDGEDALVRAVKILERHPDARDELADTLLQLGDWHMIKEERDDAMQAYSRVAELAKQEPTAAVALSYPKRLYYPLPPILISSRRLPPDEAAADRYVLLEYNVSESGAVDDARIVETNASSREANQILDSLRNARYRPRFVNGTPVHANALQYREVYKVRKDDDDNEQT